MEHDELMKKIKNAELSYYLACAGATVAARYYLRDPNSDAFRQMLRDALWDCDKRKEEWAALIKQLNHS